MSKQRINVGYIRVSDDSQQSGNGPEQQRNSLIAWALRNKLELHEIVAEAKTGTTADREVIQALLQRARNGEIERLVLDRVDRLGRVASVSLSLKDAFEAAGVEVVFVAEQFANDDMGKLIFTIMSGVAEYNRKAMLRHLKGTRRAAVQSRGSYGGGRVPPIGYRSVGGGVLEVDPKGAAMVRRVFELRAAGLASPGIAAALAREGFRTEAGTTFLPAFIRKVIEREPVYRAQVPPGNHTLAAGTHAMQPALLT